MSRNATPASETKQDTGSHGWHAKHSHAPPAANYNQPPPMGSGLNQAPPASALPSSYNQVAAALADRNQAPPAAAPSFNFNHLHPTSHLRPRQITTRPPHHPWPLPTTIRFPWRPRSVRRSSSLDWKKDRNRTEPNCKRPDHLLRLHKF